ncbi:MAG: S41 family peptidase [Parvularculaceae bacterium]|nr:S41 family peptidase [Parvularculaceae bacterium]
MISRRRFVEGATAGALFATSPTLAQSGSDWSEDIRLLRRAYDTLHPGLYRYASPAVISDRLERLERRFARGLSLSEAYLQLSEFLTTIQCGHTYANFYNQSDTVTATLFEGATRLPFQFRWLGNRMVVTAEGGGVERGSEILKIDGVPAKKVLRVLMKYARADGGNDAKRRALLSVTGDDSYETFDVFQGLLFPPHEGAFRLELCARPGDEPATVTARAIDLAARRKMSPAASNGENSPEWTLAWSSDHTGVLTMPSWALYDSSWDWKGFLNNVFAEIADRNATGLVIDLRGNEGGLDCGHEIIARLIGEGLTLDGYQRRVRYRKVPDDLNRYLDTWDNSFRDWGDQAAPLDERFFVQKKYDDDARGEVIGPKGPRFTGKAAVLIDSQNSSATFQFARIVQENRLATLIGEPTGGNKRGINGGAFFFLRLPKSGIEVDLPLIGFFPQHPQPDEGLTPDILAAPSIDDIREGRDIVLEKALGLMRSP